MDKELILVDLSGIYWAAWHSSVNDEVSAAKQRTIAKVKQMIDGFKYVAICCDSGKSFRKDIYPEYKANRPEKDVAAVEELRKTQEALKKEGLLLWSEDGFEADDIIATAANSALNDNLLVTIASGDKDLLQLVSKGVTAWSPQSMKRFGWDEVVEKFGVPPTMMRDWISLVGDKSDNIPGVPGVGAKRAAELLTKFSDIDGIQKAIADGEDVATPKILEALKASGEKLDLARDLVSLRFNVPIDFSEIYEERKPERITEEVEDMDAPDETIDEPEEVKAEPVEQKPEAPKEIAIAKPVKYEQQLEPITLNGAYRLAKGIYESRLYQQFNNVEAIWAVIIRGREMGLGAMTALDSFHVIKGKPALSAHLIIARAKAHPDCEYLQLIETDAQHAVYETKNRNNPKPTRLEYTIEDAKAAGVYSGNWPKRPAEMLRKTCGVQLARIEYPDAALGLYAVEELEDSND